MHARVWCGCLLLVASCGGSNAASPDTQPSTISTSISSDVPTTTEPGPPETLPPTPRGPVSHARIVPTGVEMVSVGGQYPDGSDAGVFLYDHALGDWRTLADEVPLVDPIALVTSAGLLVVGVEKEGDGRSVAATLALSGGAWQMHAAAPSPDALAWPRSWTWTGTQLLVMSGEAGATTSTVQSYDPLTDTWTLLPPAPLSPRTRAISLWQDGEWLVWGGGNGSAMLDDGVAFNPSTNTYRPLDESPLSHMG